MVEGRQLIKGIHGLFYTPDAEEVRAFIRDKLGLAHTNIGEGLLIFDFPRRISEFIPPTKPIIRSLSTAMTFARLLRS